MSKPEHQFVVQIRHVKADGTTPEWAADVAGVGHTQGWTLADAKVQARDMIAASREIDWDLLDLTFEVSLTDRFLERAGTILRSRGYDNYPDDPDLFDEMLQELASALAEEAQA